MSKHPPTRFQPELGRIAAAAVHRPFPAATPMFIHHAHFARVSTGVQKSPGRGKSTVFNVAKENDRIPLFSRHLKRDGRWDPATGKPFPPVIVYGAKSAREAAEAAATWAGRRGLRTTQLCAAAGVFSAPSSMDETWGPGNPGANWVRFRDLAIAALVGRFGARLVCVIEHLDESCPHCHYWLRPLDHEPFEAVHPGFEAAKLVERKGESRGAQMGAYLSAMREFQDWFFRVVGEPCGFKRDNEHAGGTKRHRYTTVKDLRAAQRQTKAAYRKGQEDIKAKFAERVAAIEEKARSEIERERLIRVAAETEVTRLRAELTAIKAGGASGSARSGLPDPRQAPTPYDTALRKDEATKASQTSTSIASPVVPQQPFDWRQEPPVDPDTGLSNVAGKRRLIDASDEEVRASFKAEADAKRMASRPGSKGYTQIDDVVPLRGASTGQATRHRSPKPE